MNTFERWDDPAFTLLRQVKRDGSNISVTFADGSTASIPVRRFLVDEPAEDAWTIPTFTEHEFSIRLDGKEIEVPGNRARLESDPAYVRYWNGIAEDQATAIGRRIQKFRVLRGMKAKELANK